MQVRTARWGDVGAPFNFIYFTDIQKVVDKFKGIPFDPGPPESGAPPKVRAMLRGNSPPLAQLVNFTDIARAIDAFKGIAYPEAGPTSCPSCP